MFHSADVWTLLEEFKRSKQALAFACIDGAANSVGSGRTEFAKALELRSSDPSLIDQDRTPLCGPAAFIHCIAKDRPEDYMRYVLELAMTGVGKLGNLTVRPSADCRNNASLTRPGLIGRAIDPVDWVALASLRDSSNAWLEMNGPDSNAAGITAGGSMASWFRATGWYPNGVSNSTYHFAKSFTEESFEHLLRINQRMNSHVCMLIRSAIIANSSMDVGRNKFGKNTPKTWFGTPDHWIVLNMGNRIRIDQRIPPPHGSLRPKGLGNKPLDFSFWSWRRTYHVSNRVPKITAKEFFPYYYGYVSASR